MTKKIALAFILLITFASTFLASVLFFSKKQISLPQSPQQILSSLKSSVPKASPKPYIISSGSMEPTLKTGGVALAIPQKTYLPGDIITFNQGGKIPVTHRVDFKLYPDGVDGEAVYLTSGDANDSLDNTEVRDNQIIGKVVASVPYMGYAANFAKKPQGFILLVIIPATIVIYEELRTLLGELKKAFKSRRKKSIFEEERGLEGNASGGLPKASILVPAIGAFLVIAAVSSSYFFDSELSLQNVLGAAASYNESLTPTTTPTPTPTKVSPTPTSTSPTPTGTKTSQISGEIAVDETCANPSQEQIDNGLCP